MARLTAAQEADLQGAAGVSSTEAEVEAMQLEDPADLEADDDGQADEHDAGAAAVLGIASERPKRTTREPDAPDGWEIPAAVRRYLKADETNVIAVRRHYVLLLLPALAFVGGLAAACALNGWAYETGHNPAVVFHGIWLAYTAAALWSLYKWAEWRQTWFVITGHRLMLVETTRLLGRRVRMLPFDKLRDLEFSQTAFGRVWKYGRFTFASIGTGGADNALTEVAYLPWPEWLYAEINEMTMPTPTRKVVRRTGRG